MFSQNLIKLQCRQKSCVHRSFCCYQFLRYLTWRLRLSEKSLQKMVFNLISTSTAFNPFQSTATYTLIWRWKTSYKIFWRKLHEVISFFIRWFRAIPLSFYFIMLLQMCKVSNFLLTNSVLFRPYWPFAVLFNTNNKFGKNKGFEVDKVD